MIGGGWWWPIYIWILSVVYIVHFDKFCILALANTDCKSSFSEKSTANIFEFKSKYLECNITEWLFRKTASIDFSSGLWISKAWAVDHPYGKKHGIHTIHKVL